MRFRQNFIYYNLDKICYYFIKYERNFFLSILITLKQRNTDHINHTFNLNKNKNKINRIFLYF